MRGLSVQGLLLGVCVVFAGIYFATTASLPRESIVFPRVMLVALLMTAVACLFGKQDRLRWSMVGDWFRNSKAPVLIGLTVAFLVLYQFIGFAPAALVFMLVSFLLFGVKPVWAAIYSLATVAVMVLVFEYSLSVALG
jgi:hypothetical protein